MIGFLSHDTIRLGELEAKNQVFAEATRTTDNFIKEQLPIDGILGIPIHNTSTMSTPE